MCHGCAFASEAGIDGALNILRRDAAQLRDLKIDQLPWLSRSYKIADTTRLRLRVVVERLSGSTFLNDIGLELLGCERHALKFIQ